MIMKGKSIRHKRVDCHKDTKSQFQTVLRQSRYCRFGNVRENLIFANNRDSLAREFKVLAKEAVYSFVFGWTLRSITSGFL